MLATVQADDLWMQDWNFCPCAFLCEIDRRGAGFITRQHEELPCEMVHVLRSVGRIETGHVAEQRVQVWDAQGGAHLFRRIRVKLDQATRDGDWVLYILTNLPLRKSLSRVYRRQTGGAARGVRGRLGIYGATRSASISSSLRRHVCGCRGRPRPPRDGPA